ncbi:unnamed protein product [Auanema sp. JU1783]|nr:unnamed protein product [Auanema sp. JU1783]
MLTANWIWYSSFILLLLRHETVQAASHRLSSNSSLIKKPKTAEELGVPKCTSNYNCVNNGACVRDADGNGRCLCPRSCPPVIPINCKYSRDDSSCLSMGDEYSRKYSIAEPTCHRSRCLCPPMFEPIVNSRFPVKNLLPTKCDKRELQVIGVAYPSDSVYKGADVTLYCCINIDPINHIDANGVTFVQNETVTREPTKHPFRELLSEYEQLTTPSCWELEIKNVQLSDSGSYMCIVTPSTNYTPVNYTIEFQVKAPRMIQNLAIHANETAANITWDIQEGPQLKIDLKLLRRTGYEGKEVWTQENAISPVTIGSLRSATPYTLFVSVRDGQLEPFQLSEHFTTLETKPLPPKYVGVRVGYNSGPSNSGSFLNCEVEWRAPALTNGRIVKYYVRVRGQLRKSRPGGPLVPDDFPPSVEKKCANWDETEQAVNGINPIEFSSDLYFCKYGPLKPNRNYTVTVWAENAAGKSSPVTFPKTCVTHYAEPDQVEKPTTSAGTNHSSFSLTFNQKPEDINGPISCYYIAVVPLPKNVSLDGLPQPANIAMDTHTKAFSNNLQPYTERKVYFAYIAESYAHLPDRTVIGDDLYIPGIKQCNMLYLSRYSVSDKPIKQGIKYTGFLIVRVDKEKDDVEVGPSLLKKKNSIRYLRSVSDSNSPHVFSSGRAIRQLHMSGPVYGYSAYFKPVFLQEDDGSSLGTVFKVVGPVLLFAVMASVVGLVIMQRRGMLSNWWPLKIAKETPERTLLKPTYQAVLIEDLPSEYLLRHRDSDFMFSQEFESLPSYAFEAFSSNRKENAAKNRYNDIRAFDSTRVKLKKINGSEYSDYINANYVNGWDMRKKFIAAQAPLENTLDDFWRMIWEQDCRVVVMVANLLEKNRNQCAKYWPDDISIRYGDYKVVPVSSNYNACYTVRTFDLIDMKSSGASGSKRSNFSSVESNIGSEYANVPSARLSGRVDTPSNDGDDVRRIVQYHFTTWNDYRAPECSTGLLRFVNKLRSLPEFNEYPVVIHCSAGVGRTGTFVAIDSMLDQLETEGKANIFSFVSDLRKQRNLMVQSLEQYVFIYKSLAEWYLYGNTDVEAEELEACYNRLIDPSDRSFRNMTTSGFASRPDSSAPKNGLESQFKKLNQTLEPTPKISFALKEENIMKNRFEAAVPYDKNRVVLAPLMGSVDDSSYINASELKGYFYPYILAQDPVSENTVFDFWRMISEKNVTTIVMLSREDDLSYSERYWPEDSCKEFIASKNQHRFIVQLLSEETFSYYHVRKLLYQSSQTGKEWVAVTQYCLLDWSTDQTVPSSASSILSLIGRVLETQSQLPDSGPIVVHCRNGSSQGGIFCSISLLLERLKTEQKVDVFQTVKMLQSQRTMMFTKLEEYDFCYRAIIEYVRHMTKCHRL